MVASNAIGNFTIGQSAIGTAQRFNVMDTVLSQYANSPIIMQLVQNLSAYFDQTKNLDDFYDVIFNINTAQGYGLDIWGRIVGVNRVLQVSAGLTFGFEEAGTVSAVGFNQGNFFSGGALTNNVALSDDAFRILIFAKALSNISDGSIASINQILLSLFPGRGNCYIVDGLNMTMTYTFTFATTDVEKAIIQGSGILPKPTGVQVQYSFA